MTEEEWLTCTDPQPMLEFLRAIASERKLRLFACACSQTVVPLLVDCDACLRAMEVAESHADGKASERAVADAQVHVNIEWLNFGDNLRHLNAAASLMLSAIDHHPHQITRLCLAEMVREAVAEEFPDEAAVLGALSRAQPLLLRCVFGNPFRPASAFTPSVLSWNDGTVVKLAESIYNERAFDRLPVLADALEDAGCTEAELLGHLRSAGPHVRGCWALDAVLGKS
jgi:hypothetical protein